MPASVSRQLMKAHHHADWQAADEPAWENLLAPILFTTRTTFDAAGSSLIRTDAYGNVQRQAYDIGGQLKGSWLTLKGLPEHVVVASLTYSAQGKKLREEHGNGVVTTYRMTGRASGWLALKPSVQQGMPAVPGSCKTCVMTMTRWAMCYGYTMMPKPPGSGVIKK